MPIGGGAHSSLRCAELCPHTHSQGPEQTIPVSAQQFPPWAATDLRVFSDSSQTLNVGIEHRYLLSAWRDLHFHQHVEILPSPVEKAPQLSDSWRQHRRHDHWTALSPCWKPTHTFPFHSTTCACQCWAISLSAVCCDVLHHYFHTFSEGQGVPWSIAVKDFPLCLFSISSFSNIFLKPKEDFFPESKHTTQSLSTKERVMKPEAQMASEE